MQRTLTALLLLPGMLFAAGTDTPARLQAGYAAEALATSPAAGPLSAERGRQFFTSRHGGDWSCASCHTTDARKSGRHAVTGKVLKPLAPAANPDRFTDATKVEKWFRRNCKDVLGRECSAREKGDVLTYLQSLR
ncbi:MAG TPA: hypothetical protein DF427_01700 [Moraxellaceae bacterium]|nr:hypothetical protein [Moraxellaceae bacterium]